jgi:hypothetical protein
MISPVEIKPGNVFQPEEKTILAIPGIDCCPNRLLNAHESEGGTWIGYDRNRGGYTRRKEDTTIYIIHKMTAKCFFHKPENSELIVGNTQLTTCMKCEGKIRQWPEKVDVKIKSYEICRNSSKTFFGRIPEYTSTQ